MSKQIDRYLLYIDILLYYYIRLQIIYQIILDILYIDRYLLLYLHTFSKIMPNI